MHYDIAILEKPGVAVTPTAFAIEPELRAFYPRRVHFTPLANRRRVAWYVLLLLVPTLTAWQSQKAIQTWNDFLRHGLRTDATIVSAVRVGTEAAYPPGDPYRFEYQGVRVEGDGSELAAKVDDRQKLPKVPVTFLPTNPHIFVEGVPNREAVNARTTDQYIGVGVLTLICLATLAAIERYYRSLNELLRTGEAVIGHVDNERVEDDGVTSPLLRYRYPVTRSREAINDVPWPTMNHRRYQSGAPLTVLRDRQRPERSLPYASVRHIVAVADSGHKHRKVDQR